MATDWKLVPLLSSQPRTDPFSPNLKAVLHSPSDDFKYWDDDFWNPCRIKIASNKSLLTSDVSLGLKIVFKDTSKAFNISFRTTTREIHVARLIWLTNSLRIGLVMLELELSCEISIDNPRLTLSRLLHCRFTDVSLNAYFSTRFFTTQLRLKRLNVFQKRIVSDDDEQFDVCILFT